MAESGQPEEEGPARLVASTPDVVARGDSHVVAAAGARARAGAGFIRTVVENVEIAAVFNNATNGPMVGAFVGSVYPESYPASLPAYELAFSVTYRDVIDAAVPYEFRSALDDIGLESTRWP